MAALNRFFTTPAYIASCLVALWLAFIASVLLFNPIASQNTKIHQLGFFTQYALNLVHHLQLERAASAGFVATHHSEHYSSRLKNQQNRTDAVYQSFKKQRGRFNSTDFGSALTASLEAAVTQLSQLDEMRVGISKGNADITLTTESYSNAIEHLNTAISQLETVEMEDPATAKLRENFLGHLEASESSARDIIRNHPVETANAEWLETIEKKQNRVLTLAKSEFNQIMTKTSTEAARRAYFFVISLLVVIIATLAAIAWYRPSTLDQSLLIAVIFFNVALVMWTMTTGPFWMSKESGPIESLHTIILAVAFALFCRKAINHPSSSRLAAIVMACLCLLMFFRELDLRVFDAPEWLINVITPRLRKWLSLVLIIMTGVYAAASYRHIPGLIRSSLTWRAWPFYVWPVLLVAGEKVELLTHETRQDDLPGYWANGQFWEELLELNAYIALLYGAYIFAEIYRKGVNQRAFTQRVAVKRPAN